MTFESSVTNLALTAAAAAALVLGLTVVMLRRALPNDWRTLSFRVDDAVGVTVLTVLAAMVRLPALFHPMGTDESATFLYYASKPLLVGISVYGSPNNHVLHTALMHVAFRIFGDVEWALRLPAFVAGVALVPLTAIAARSARATGLVAAAIVAGWPALVDYSTDGRGYTLLACFVIICTIAFVDILESGNRAACAIFIVSASLGFFTIPVMIYPFAFLIAVGLRRRREEMLICAAGTALVTTCLYAPVLVVSGIGAMTANPYVRPLPIGAFVRALPHYAVIAWRANFVAVPVVLQVLIAAASAIAVARRRAVFAGAILVMAIVLMQRVTPFPRVWLPFIPLMAIGVGSIRMHAHRTIATALFIALATGALMTPHLRDTGELRAVRDIVRELRVRDRARAPVLSAPPSDLPLAFYTRRQDILFPDARRPRMFLIENRDYGPPREAIMRAYSIDASAYRIRVVRDFGSAVLYELIRL